MFKRIIVLATVALGAFFTAMMLLNLWSEKVQFVFDKSVLGKLTLTSGMLSVAFIALLIVMKLAEKK
ncbi:MAG: hypothetical protein PHU56_00470 [Candidatus Pacebacteria bacterium]|nr:hypothetical protein [Candidatus Paceibacterota bacterium]